jgi:hypothetical protein
MTSRAMVADGAFAHSLRDAKAISLWLRNFAPIPDASELRFPTFGSRTDIYILGFPLD